MNTEQKSEQVKEKSPSKPKRPKVKPKPVDPSAPPKITRKLKKEIELAATNIDGIVRHIRNVQDNCILLGKGLIQQGHIDLGVNLIRNGFLHDSSKFVGIEWENMAPTGLSFQESVAKLKLKMAIHHHQVTNPHHVEHWVGGITQMPLLYLAEMVCDLKSRSEEFGTSVKEYIDDQCIRKWNITKDSSTYKKITEFLDLLCEKPFGKI